jgi:hypothetical protein
MAQGDAAKPDSEIARREELGINYELMHDDDIEELLTNAMYLDEYITTVDASGKTTKVDKVERAYIDYDMAAARIMISPANRVSYVSRDLANLMRLRNSRLIKCIKMQMRPDRYNLGQANFFRAIETYVDYMLSDAIGGRKAELLKRSPRETTFRAEVLNEKKNKGVVA